MIIVIPLFGKRISPHFGSSSTVLVATVRNRAVMEKRLVVLGGPDVDKATEFVSKLLEFLPDMVICGGIRREHKKWLQQKGVRVVENQMGLAEEKLISIAQSLTEQ